MAKDSELVYSTNPEYSRQKNIKAKAEENKSLNEQTARIFLDRKGRKGKSVTVIEGLAVNPQHLAEIARDLKQSVGSGGTVKQGRIEIQGDHRKAVAEKLNELGIKIKHIGA